MTKLSFPSYDLNEMKSILNARFFDNKITTSIRWAGKNWTSKWGHYSPRKNEIVMNSILKKAPTWVVASTVYHEMLHEAIPSRINPRNGRWIRHGSEFKRREKLYPYFNQSKSWKKENAALLFSSSSPVQSQSPLGQTYEGFRVGQVVETTSGKKFEITGFKPRNWKFPIIAKNLRTNASYKLSKEQITSGSQENKEIKSLIKKATGIQEWAGYQVGQAIKVRGAGPRLSKMIWTIVELKPGSKHQIIAKNENGTQYRLNTLQVIV